MCRFIESQDSYVIGALLQRYGLGYGYSWGHYTPRPRNYRSKGKSTSINRSVQVDQITRDLGCMSVEARPSSTLSQPVTNIAASKNPKELTKAKTGANKNNAVSYYPRYIFIAARLTMRK